MSRRHADNWSHPGPYLVDPYTWLGHKMVMVMNDLLSPPLCNVNQPSHSGIQIFQNLTMKIHGQGHVCGKRWRSLSNFKIQRSRLWQSQTHWSNLRPGVKFICLLFGNRTTFGWGIRNSIFDLEEKVKVMAKVKPDGHIWALEFNRYVCFLFRCNRTIFLLRYSKFHIWPWKI